MNADTYTHGCGFTKDYIDEPHGIICFHTNGENGQLMDVDKFHEGFDPHDYYPSCPNCNWREFEKELREEYFDSAENPSEQKFKSIAFRWKRIVKKRMS